MHFNATGVYKKFWIFLEWAALLCWAALLVLFLGTTSVMWFCRSGFSSVLLFWLLIVLSGFLQLVFSAFLLLVLVAISSCGFCTVLVSEFLLATGFCNLQLHFVGLAFASIPQREYSLVLCAGKISYGLLIHTVVRRVYRSFRETPLLFSNGVFLLSDRRSGFQMMAPGAI